MLKQQKTANPTGEGYQAIADFNLAINVDPNFSPACNNMAWQLATCPKAAIRNGRKAVGYATKACELSQWSKVNQISTLAAAYAEFGDFESAIKWETRVLGSSNLTPEEVAKAKARLALYQTHQPCHREIVQLIPSPANQ